MMCKKKYKINCKIYSSDMMFSDTKTEFCNFCENNFNCNNKNIEDVKNLYKKYKINFNSCSACIFLFNTETEMYIEWPSGFFKAGFSLILHALLAMSNHSGRNFKNLNKTSVVCIELESDLFFAILGSFCREL